MYKRQPWSHISVTVLCFLFLLRDRDLYYHNTIPFACLLYTSASMLFDAGVKAIDIQPLLGHSNLAMTQHYIGQRTTERDSTEMARILA